ncbi:MAG: hypothetical protein ACRC62_09960 [Microcoleus sp.]
MAYKILRPSQLFRKKRIANKEIIERFEKLIMNEIEKEFNGGDEKFSITIEDVKSEFESIQGFVIESFKNSDWKIFDIGTTNYQTPSATVKLSVEAIPYQLDSQTEDDIED